MYIVTFYSFRGGVGRTTALVEVGLQLARRGQKVLLVDFDLESPSLDLQSLALASSSPLTRPVKERGVVEFITAYREKNCAADIRDYIYSVAPVGDKGGHVWVMPAGKGGPEYRAAKWAWRLGTQEEGQTQRSEHEPEYWEALAAINWQALYDREDGYLFFEDTREQWRSLDPKPDYVLIDTHSGITPSLGITTRQLADAVVMMVNPRQIPDNGLDDVSWSIKEESKRTSRPIEQLFVATKVLEADEAGDTSWEHYKNAVGSIPYAASVPLSNRLLLRQQPNSLSGLAREYSRLANAIIKANVAGDSDEARFAKGGNKMNSDLATEKQDCGFCWQCGKLSRLEELPDAWEYGGKCGCGSKGFQRPITRAHAFALSYIVGVYGKFMRITECQTLEEARQIAEEGIKHHKEWAEENR